MNIMLRRFVIAFLMFNSLPVFSQGNVNADYQRGYEKWSAKDWPAASTILSRYWRDVPFGRTYDVSYWLGTSWCRQKGAELPGADLLDWSYHFQNMPEATRGEFRTQRDLCIKWLSDTQGERVAPAIVLAGAWTSATMRAEGKTYYLGNEDKGGLSAYPVRIKRKLGEEAFANRLVKIGDVNAITRALQTQAPGFTTHVGDEFAIASNVHTPDQLRRIATQLDRFAEFLEAIYELPAPQHYVTIYLFKDTAQLRVWADKLHGLDASPMTLGYSLQNDLSVLAMVPSTQVGTILHEVFHLLLPGAYGDAPQWLDEGIASLYETATFENGKYYGEPNWRSRVFADFEHAFGREKLKDIIMSPWFSDEPRLAASHNERQMDPDEQAYLLAYSRMFVLYLQEQGVLTQVVKAFRDREVPTHFVSAPDQAIALLEKTLNKSLLDIQSDFLAWAPRATNPEVRLHSGEAILKTLPTNPNSAANAIDR